MSDMDIKKAISNLQAVRGIFHSEADFQFALAWEIQKLYPAATVRMEYCYPIRNNSLHIDLVVSLGEDWYPIELKYKTSKLEFTTTGLSKELYRLKGHGAQDCGRYDFLLDIQRLELLAEDLPRFKTGYAIFLTNDSTYWKDSKRVGTTYEAFKLADGLTKEGTMQWAEHTGKGTMETREVPITLKGRHAIKWNDYSRLNLPEAGVFKYVLVPVGKSIDASQI